MTLAPAVGLFVAAAWSLAGVLLLGQPRLRRLGLLALGGCGLGVAVAAADMADAAFIRGVGLGLVPAAAFHLLLALPHGVLGSGGRRAAVLLAYALGAASGLLLVDEVVWWPVWITSVAAAAVGIPVSHGRYAKATPRDRQRMQWLGCAAAVVVEVGLLGLALRVLLGWPTGACPALGAFTAVVPLALAAGASPRLTMRADRLLVSTVAFMGVTGVVTGIYLLVVLGLGRSPSEGERSVLLLSMAAAGVAALTYVPARQRLSRFANRLVYGEREAPDAVLRTFGSRLSRSVPMDELLLQLAESLKKTMQLVSVEVWTGANGRFDLAVALPERARPAIVLGAKEAPVVLRAGVVGPAWLGVWLPALLEDRPGGAVRVAPVTNSGQLLGFLAVERAADTEAFTDEDERVLTELARQVGLALHNLQLDSALQATVDELRASRARIVATADAERRKIERNLHDGAQQHLVALAVSLRLVKDTVEDDPASAAALIDQLADDVKATLQELRDLAHGIYPPLLMDSGLAAALRAAAGRSPLDVDVEAPESRFPTEVEAAVYFCCMEALQNAAKHAPGSSVSVRLEEVDGRLSFEVADDGPGFDPAERRSGHGFVNMDDRLGAIGGVLTVRSAPGSGTRVSGVVPVGAEVRA